MIKLSALCAVAVLATTDTVGITPPWGSLGIAGVLAWYLYYDVRHTRPAERKSHNEHVEQIIAASDRHNRAIVDDFRADLEAERQLRDSTAERFTKAITESTQSRGTVQSKGTV